ncbi:hypothetical protein CYMTET_4928 [Cymbomonas tetramitiformis]|uniref:JmjC domain-containing protein n=1 Tax=Cymbomonas tetramitiformis TaxID=36881 RepID=A0AAE0H0F3_9CHLO|nr:hypothetical protein CYMTET_4928 [Cymbomonas tetramitiformis]
MKLESKTTSPQKVDVSNLQQILRLSSGDEASVNRAKTHPVTSASLGALSKEDERSRESVNFPQAPSEDAESCAEQVPPYLAREEFSPTEQRHFGAGGSFPEVHILQYPLDMGRGLDGPSGCPVSLDIDYDALQLKVSKFVLCQSESTVEYEAFLDFTDRDQVDPLSQIVGARSVERASNVDPGTVAARCFQGSGKPLIFTDGMRDWDALSTWSLEYFQEKYGSDLVMANDRAPARHADEAIDRKQRTVHMPLADYLSYCQRLCQPDLPESERRKVPFYLNGWRAYSQHPELMHDIPGPYFTSQCDHTCMVLAQVDKLVFKAQSSDDGDAPWVSGMNMSLNKLFVGPPGTITRMHYDAGEAHAWLGQVAGRKLFICFSPDDSQYLYKMETETETAQSPIDPLRPDFTKYPLYKLATPYAFILQPGEMVLVPKGWWHYAAALDMSITAMRNFYHAPSNAQDLVKYVMTLLKKKRVEQVQQRGTSEGG